MLPPHATTISQQLFTHAQRFLKTCPPALYEEVAVSGSVARGIADQYSDCEVVFWSEKLLPPDAYKTWLESLGNDVKLMRESPDGDTALYLEYNIDGVKLGSVWQTWHSLDDMVTALDSNRLPTRETDPWMLSYVIPMGHAPRLNLYRARVRDYPDALRRNIIEARLGVWRWLIGVADVFIGEPVARRGQLYDLRRRQLMTIKDLLYMLFAYNRLWPPDTKWFGEEAARMTHKPPRLMERIDTLLTERDPYTVMSTMRDLQVETLRILSSDFAVDNLIAGLEAILIED